MNHEYCNSCGKDQTHNGKITNCPCTGNVRDTGEVDQFGEYKSGDEVELTEGPFKGQKAIIDCIIPDAKLIVAITKVFGHDVLVEIGI